MLLKSPKPIMRITNVAAIRMIAVLLLFLIQFSLHAQDRKQISFQKETIENVLKKMNTEYSVRFFYSGSSIDKRTTISMPLKSRSLVEVLQYLEANYNMAFKQEGNMISVYTKSKEIISSKKIVGRIGLQENESVLFLSGVTIHELGTNNTTLTDNEGYFNLSLKQENAVLEISYTGYETSKREVAANENIELVLVPFSKVIEEVVVSTGYQTFAKKNTTGAFSTISAQEIARRSSQSIEQVLEGSVPGLTLATAYSGFSKDKRPNGVDFQVRGGSAIATDRNTPLIVVDGFPVNQLPDNLNDVEKIDVLKDAAASAVWGARAANGVIVITTKRGRQGKVNINYATNMYFTQKPNYSKLFRASSADVVDYDRESYDLGFISNDFFSPASGYSPSIGLLLQLEKGIITEQQYQQKKDSLSGISNKSQIEDLLLNTGFRQNQYLSLSGGADKYRYLISGSYDKTASNYVSNSSETFQLSSRSDIELTRFLRLSLDLNMTSGKVNVPPYANNSIQNLPPYQLILDNQGKYLYDYTGFNVSENSTLKTLGYLENGYNILEDARLANNINKNFGLRSKVGFQIKIIDGLTFNTDYLYDKMKLSGKNIINQSSYQARSYLNRYATLGAGNKIVYNLPLGDILNSAENTNNSWAFRSQLNFTKMYQSVHYVNLAMGTEVKKRMSEGYSNQKFGYNDDLLSWQLFDQKLLANGGLTWWDGTAVPRLDATSLDRFNYNDIRERSIYGTGVYTYDNRYTATGSYRIDESNLFGADPKYRRTPLWSAGLSWNVANEKFFNIPSINFLKLRLTTGLTGNYDPTTTPLLVATKTFQTSLNDFRARVNYFNPKLRWERTQTYNAGLDFGMLKERLQVSADFYHKYGYDLLGSTILDPTVGFTTFRINAAKMVNNGLELAIRATVIDSKSFSWNTILNFGYNKNKITENKIQDGAPEINRVTGTTAYVEGYSRETLWSYRWAGIDSTGNPLVYGDNDQKVKAPVFSSLVNSGVYRAPYSGGFTNLFYYKNFFASAFVVYNFGHVLRRAMPSMNPLDFGSNYNYQIKDRWRKSGDEAHTNIPGIIQSWEHFYDGRDRAILYSTESVIPGDNIRLREVQLGYNLPSSIIKKGFIKGGSLIVQMNNVALWGKNKFGIDPEAMEPFSGTYNLPTPMVTTLTLKINL